jgi:hypothetical protein
MPKDKRTRFIDIRQTTFGVASAAGGTTGGEEAPDAVPPSAPPSEPPANLTLTTALVNIECIPVATITASWDAPAGREPAFYLVQYAHTSAFLVADTQEIVSADVETTIGFLSAETTYYVRVAAVTGGIRSAWCTPASITTDAVTSAMTLILRPTKAGGAGNDGVWAYDVDAATWTLYGEGLLPSGWRWGTIAVNPTNQLEWVVFGAPNNSYGAVFDQAFMASEPSIAVSGGGAVVARGTSTRAIWRTADGGATWHAVNLTASQIGFWIDCFYIAFDSLGAFHAIGVQRASSGGTATRTITRWRGDPAGTLAGTDLTPWTGPGINPNNIVIHGMTTGQAGETYFSFFHYNYLSVPDGYWPVGQVTSGGSLSVLSYLNGKLPRQMARQYGSDHVAGIGEDLNFAIAGLLDTSDITASGMSLYTDVNVDHKPCLILADGTVVTSDGAGSDVLTAWTIGVSQATVFGPLSGEAFGVGVADVLDGTQAAVNIFSTTNSRGKNVVYFDSATWTEITGPSASSNTTIANTIALVRISGNDCTHGCPPNMHHGNHEIGGCDPLLLQLIDGEITDTQHGDRSGGSLHDIATEADYGFAILAPDGGTDAGTVVQGNDSRLTGGGVPTPTGAGQLIMSLDGATWSRVIAITSLDDGWLVGPAGELLVTEV